MYVRCWGSRGSIPVSGKEFIKYGGDTTCIEVSDSDGNTVIIDAGSGIRLFGDKLVKECRNSFTMLFTHHHWDHMLGLPFFKPLFRSTTKIDIFAKPYNAMPVKSLFRSLFARPYSPIELKDKDIKAEISYKKLSERAMTIGNLKIKPIALSHPKDGGFGFKFTEGDKSFVFLTDNELGHVHKGGHEFRDYAEFCRDVDLLIHDAQYTKEEYDAILKISNVPWGHSTYEDVVKLAVESNAKLVGLFHLDPAHTDKFIDEEVKKVKAFIKDAGGKSKCFSVSSHFEIEL